jgi:outer membrane protein TolC
VQRLLGAHGEEADWRVKGPLPSVPTESRVPDELEKRALRANIELKGTKQRLEGLARRAGVTRTAGFLPDVTADVHLLQGNPDETPGNPEQSEWRIGAGVSATIPLFDRNQGTVTSLEAEFDALMERYYGMAIDLRSAARDTRNRLVSVHARALQYQDVIVPAQRQVTEQTILQYNAMQIGIFQLIEARRQELDVEVSYVEMSREYWTAVAELDALLAGRSVSPEAASANVSFGTTSESRGEH